MFKIEDVSFTPIMKTEYFTRSGRSTTKACLRTSEVICSKQKTFHLVIRMEYSTKIDGSIDESKFSKRAQSKATDIQARTLTEENQTQPNTPPKYPNCHSSKLGLCPFVIVLTMPGNLQHKTIIWHEMDTNLLSLGEPLTGVIHNWIDPSNPLIKRVDFV